METEANLTDYVALNSSQEEAERDPFTPWRYRQFARYLAPDAVAVLDVGCATGRGGRSLKEVRPDISIRGLDCLADRLARLPKDIYDEGVCSFTTNIDAAENSYDAIVAGEFIEHLSYRDGLQTLDEFKRILKPGGQLMMTTPYPDYLRLVLTGGDTMGGAHVSAHYPKQLKVMMENAGFCSIRFLPSGSMTRLLSDRLPFLWLYGSFLIIGNA